MIRPEHNTYDFPDDIETVFDVDIEAAKAITDDDTKEEYLKSIRKLSLGTDFIYMQLSAYYGDVDESKADYYDSLISEDYSEEIS